MVIGVKKVVFPAFFWVLFFDSSLSARCLQKTVNVSVVEEVINGKAFTHRIDIINGKRDERWAIDGQAAEYKEYEEMLLEAEKQERRQERLKQQEEQQKHDEFVIAVQRDGCAKIIELSLTKINYELSRLADKRLEPFLAFDEHTIFSAQELDTLKNVVIARAHEILNQKGDIQLDELRRMMAKLEPMPDRLRAFYYATVKNAQARSDDTKLLKDLLAIVSEPQ